MPKTESPASTPKVSNSTVSVEITEAMRNLPESVRSLITDGLLELQQRVASKSAPEYGNGLLQLFNALQDVTHEGRFLGK